MLSEAERRSTTIHEAAHAIGFLRAGHRIEEIRIGDWDEDTRGNVRLDFGDDRRPDYGFLVAVAMGPLATGKAPPRYEQLTLRSEGDAFHLAFLTRLLRLDHAAYNAAIGIALHLLDAPDFKAAHALLCDALARVPVITGPQLDALLGPHLARLQPEGAARAA